MHMEMLPTAIRPRTLTFRIVAIFCATSLVTTAILSVFFIRNTSEIIMDNNRAFMDIYAKIISDNIDAYVNEMDRTARILLGNTSVQEIMGRRNRGVDPLQMVRDYEQMQNSIWSISSLRDNYRVIIADESGDLYYKDSAIYTFSNNNIFDDGLIQENKEILSRGDFLLLCTYQTNYTFMIDKPVFVLVRELKNISNDRSIAYVLVLFELEAFTNKLSESLPVDFNVEAVVVNGEGNVALSLDRGLIGTPASGEEADHRYYAYVSPVTGWTTRLSTPVQQAMTPTNVALGIFLPLAIMVLLGSIVIATFMFAYVLTPMRRLVGAMEEVVGGNLAVNLEGDAHSADIATLYDGFNRMMGEIDDLTEAVVQERMMLNNAQMTALRYQISPHFLYNTLQTMEAIGEVHGVQEIQVIATSLGNLLRYNIRGTSSALLSEELNHVDTYLRIEQIRFRSKLRYRIEAGRESKSCAVPRFILQPIVENCIVHGGKNLSRPLEVTVHAALEGELLVITVDNTGPPMPPARLEEIRGHLQDIAHRDHAVNGESIGIYNPHRRIVTRFGSGYGINFTYSDERGTRVRITMPARPEL